MNKERDVDEPRNTTKQEFFAPKLSIASAPRKAIVDAPIMRSMALASPDSSLKTASSLEQIKNTRTSPIEKINVKDYFEEKFIEKNVKWRINNEGLRPIPHLYPLEKSSRKIVSTSASEVAARICECLRILSVSAEFNNAEASALLKSSDYVEMYVHLFFGGAAATTVVEVQRRRGCSILFHKYSRSILEAADGCWDSNATLTQSPISKPMKLESREREDKKNKHENVLLALEIAGGLIKKDRLDANRLGMESLCLLTDPRKTGNYTATMASRVVLFGSVGIDEEEDLNESHSNIRLVILSLVLKHCLNDSDLKDDEDDFEFRHPDEKEHIDLLHNLGLAVLANALSVFCASMINSGNVSVDTFIHESQVEKDCDIISKLIEEIKKASTHLHDAFLSAKCLRLLVSASSDAKSKASLLGVINVATKAKEIGRESHALLASETEHLLEVMS